MALITALASTGLAGCSGFGATKKSEQVIEPNVYPAKYATQIASFLRTALVDREDFHGAFIAEPALKPVGTMPHYVVCLRFNGHNVPKEKVVIYLAGDITQFISSRPEQCADAAFRPYQELEAMTPQ